MPQLPSVSELMIGALLPRRAERSSLLQASPAHSVELSPQFTEPSFSQSRLSVSSITLNMSDYTPGSAFASGPNMSPYSIGPAPTSTSSAHISKDYFSYNHAPQGPRAGSVLLMELVSYMAAPKLVQSYSGPTPGVADRAGVVRAESSPAVVDAGVHPAGALPMAAGPLVGPQVMPYMPMGAYNPLAHYNMPSTSAPIHNSPAQAQTPYGYGMAPGPGPGMPVPYGVQYYSPMLIGPGASGPSLEGSHVPRAMEECNNALINKRRIIKRRTRTGCLTCRKRRIKCDERKPHCFNCERSKKVCLGYESNPSTGARLRMEEAAKQKRRQPSIKDLL